MCFISPACDLVRYGVGRGGGEGADDSTLKDPSLLGQKLPQMLPPPPSPLPSFSPSQDKKSLLLKMAIIICKNTSKKLRYSTLIFTSLPFFLFICL